MAKFEGKNPNLADTETAMVSLVGVGVGLPGLHLHPCIHRPFNSSHNKQITASTN